MPMLINLLLTLLTITRTHILKDISARIAKARCTLFLAYLRLYLDIASKR